MQQTIINHLPCLISIASAAIIFYNLGVSRKESKSPLNSFKTPNKQESDLRQYEAMRMRYGVRQMA